MSAYTSLRITRSKAKQVAVEWFLNAINDEKLEEFMDCVLEHRLYNAVIVPDDDPNDDYLV